jgi:uncharacterized protein with NRDE domain
MCLIALALGTSERFAFAVAANRDEYLDRPTQPLSLWRSDKGQSILAGRDLQSGGIWMGFAPNGRFAMLTNVRQPNVASPDNARSKVRWPLRKASNPCVTRVST